MVDRGRRAFFRGRPRISLQLRPPWALPEPAFLAACTRCAACLPACPEAIIKAGEGGYPTLDFRHGGCTLCGACRTACAPGALRREDERPPLTGLAEIGPSCLPAHGVECRVCGEHCAEGAIRFVPRRGGSPLPECLAATCTGCGACLAPCPVGAITVRPRAALSDAAADVL